MSASLHALSAHWRCAVAAALLTAASACVSSSATHRDRTAPAPRSSFRPLTAAEISLGHAGTAYEAIARLRPSVIALMRRGALAEPTVYLDGVRLGGLRELRGIPAEAVYEVRFLDTIQATAQYGTGHPAGAVVIRSRSGD